MFLLVYLPSCSNLCCSMFSVDHTSSLSDTAFKGKPLPCSPCTTCLPQRIFVNMLKICSVQFSCFILQHSDSVGSQFAFASSFFRWLGGTMGGGKDKHGEGDKGLFSNIMHGVAGGHGYPHQGYPPQGYPPPPGAYPPPPGAYPPPPGAYPPAPGAYPPQHGYPQPGGYPPQHGGYPPAGYPGSSHQGMNCSYILCLLAFKSTEPSEQLSSIPTEIHQVIVLFFPKNSK
jgi:hypothetical protein